MPETDSIQNPGTVLGDGKSISSVVGTIANAIANHLGTGDVADLRRLRPDNPASPAFWKVMAEYWDMPAGDDEAQRRACLVSGLARTAGFHDYSTGLGTALATADYSELRFIRLLRASGKTLFKEIELAAEFLNSKAQQANWVDIAGLLFTRDDAKSESLRRRIARDYYTQQHKNKEK